MPLSAMTRLTRRNALLIGAALVLAVAADLTRRSAMWERMASGGPGPVRGRVPDPVAGVIGPDPGTRIAFLGDTGAGPDFERVLQLVRQEGAQAVVHLGDATYDETAAQFWAVVDRVLGHAFPYFLAQGNHDVPHWPTLAEHGLQHLRGSGAETDVGSLVDPRFAFRFRGLSFVMLGQAAQEDDPRYIIDRFATDGHIWKLCSWHKNQQALQLGGKTDEMGWGVYESCRRMGALITNGHEHSYHRTKTLSSLIEQRVDDRCSDPQRPCVRPGAVPVFVTGLGGRSIRDQERCLPDRYPYGCNGEWAFVYTLNQQAKYGALIISFGVGGDPRRAHGVFRNIDGQAVDEFDLTAAGP
jgi:predicted phosphodiesterase